ncbi:TPA: hypothetical protein EYN65_11560, partial [Candidatus Poribacteria bacterium]|nr:hypothetical protein [Candidatus Poribacteria bacterium]
MILYSWFKFRVLITIYRSTDHRNIFLIRLGVKMNFNRRNYPPTHGIRVPSEDMKQLVINLFTKVSMSVENARVMADLLVQTDLHCVFSHGTKQLADYIRMIREGRVNPQPKIAVVSQSKSALVLDGDGGMGHLPCYFGTQQVISKAKEHGCATLTTRN